MKKKMKSEVRLGIDIGGVIVGATAPDGRRDTRFLDDTDEGALETPPNEGAIEAVRTLVDRLDGRVWLVSKCGDRIRRRTKAWLRHQRFYERTGLPQPHVRFCYRRPEKRIHARQLHLTAFIDDRTDVLRNLEEDVPLLILFGHQKAAAGATGRYVHCVEWSSVLDELAQRLSAA